MSDPKLEQMVREGIEAFNRADWDAMREMNNPELTYEEPATGRTAQGFEEFLEGLRAWRTAIPDCTGEVVRVLADGDEAAVEILWRGTHDGPLATGAGEIPASGRPIAMSSFMWQTWRDGRIVHTRHLQDILGLMTQIGAVPAGG